MKNNKTNTTLVANNSLSLPENNSLRQSLHIAALDRYLGLNGLIFPVKDTVNGLDYDFFHPESGRLIKVVTTVSNEMVDSYTPANPDDAPIFIIDVDVIHEHLDEDFCADSGEVLDAFALVDAFIYSDGALWEYYSKEETDGWIPMIPIERKRCAEELESFKAKWLERES